MTKDPYVNTPPHEVLFHVGFGDHQVANVSAEVEARTVGAAPRTLGPFRKSLTAACFFDDGQHLFTVGLENLGSSVTARAGANIDSSRAYAAPPL